MRKFIIFVLVVMLCVFSGTLLFGGAEEVKKEELIIYHWWTAGGEKEAIDAVFELFREKYPNIEIIENPVAGGGGGVMRGNIKTMVMAGESPDTFQLTYGSGMLASFAEVLEPIDELWEGLPFPEIIKENGDSEWTQSCYSTQYNEV